MKTSSFNIATVLVVAVAAFLLYVSLQALVLRSDTLLPGALLHLPAEPAKGIALLFSDAPRVDERARYAQSLLSLSYAVLELPRPPRALVQLATLAEQFAARAGVAAHRPVLVAIGPQASREAARLLSSGAKVHALVSVDYCPAAEPDATPGAGLTRPPWYALQHREQGCLAGDIEAALAAQPNTHLTWLASALAPDHTSPVEFGALLQWLDPGIDGQGQASASLRGIPLIELPVANARRAVIFFSGDGGWAALDRGVAAALNGEGIAVLGWDSLSYFWQARSPAVLARDLDRVIEEFRARWHVSQVVVVGYSFGASTAPFAVSGLPAATRAMIEKVVLLGPTPTTSFEFRLSQWLGSDAHDTAAVAPEVAKLASLPVWCVHGEKDSEAQCPPLAPPSRVVVLPGDHHFNNDYVALARLITAPPLMR